MRSRLGICALGMVLGLWGGPGVASGQAAVTKDCETINGWIILDGDMSKAREAIQRAPQFGINHIELSHELIMDIDDALKNGPALDELAFMADGLQIDTYVWSHEFSHIKGLSACFDPRHENSILRERQEKYRQALQLMPHVDGVVLMYGSSDVAPWMAACTCPQCLEGAQNADPLKVPSPEERVRKVAEAVDDVVSGELGKRTILRTFDHSPEEHRIILEGLRLARTPIMAMSKDVPQDWEPYYPNDPAFGNVGPRHEMAELDLAGEYWGQSEIPFCAVEYFKRRIDYQRSRGVCGAAGRISRGSRHAFGTPNEVNIYAVSMFVSDPSATPEQVWARFISERYGLAPEDPVQSQLMRLLRNTYDVGRKMYYPKGFWALEKGSDVPKEGTSPKLLKGRSISLWDPDYQSWFEELSQPTEQTLSDLWQEKVEARDLADWNLLAFAEVEQRLKPEDAQDLRKRLEHQRLAVEIWTHVTDAVFRKPVFERTRDEAHGRILAWDLARLTELADQMEQKFGERVAVGSPGRVRSFVSSLQGLVKDVESKSLRQTELTGIRAEQISKDSAAIRWSSSEKATSQVEFGTEIPDYGSVSDEETKRVLDHEVTLSGLSPGARYVFRVKSRDKKDRLIVSGDFGFETGK